jgi:hypothetical protein
MPYELAPVEVLAFPLPDIAGTIQYRIVNISANRLEHLCRRAYSSQNVESVPVTQMNFQWREGVYDQCALYEELIRDDAKSSDASYGSLKRTARRMP